MAIKLGNHQYRALKYNLYHGYELVYAEHSHLYSRTISDKLAHRLFSNDFLLSAQNNWEIINSPYYGERKTWRETGLYESWAIA